MKRICAWCNKPLEEEEGSQEQHITHGICINCESNIDFQCGVSVQKYIDSIERPICIVGKDGVVLTANHVAQKMLDKSLCQIQGLPGGNVFECAYARLPQGCGNTVHCSGCTIRKAVMDTLDTGINRTDIPAVIRQGVPEKIYELPLKISTEKIGVIVYLRIDS